MQQIDWKIFKVLEGVPAAAATAATVAYYCGIKASLFI